MLLISNMGHQHYTCFFFKHYTHVFQACDWDIKTSLKQGRNMKIDPLWVKYRYFKQKFGSKTHKIKRKSAKNGEITIV